MLEFFNRVYSHFLVRVTVALIMVCYGVEKRLVVMALEVCYWLLECILSFIVRSIASEKIELILDLHCHMANILLIGIIELM